MSPTETCTEVQQVISAAFDGDVPDPVALDAAKEHCRTCTGCAGFVNLLAEMRRLPAPEVPAAVLERTLTAVDSEASALAATEAEAGAESAPAPDPTAGTVAQSEGTASPARPQWRSWAPWATAAALFFVVAGLATVQGVRFLLSPGTDGPAVSDTVTLQESGTASREAPTESGPAGADPGTPGADAMETPVPVTGPAYVTLSGRVFRYDSVADLPPGAPSTSTLTSGLDTGSAATQRGVFEDPGSDAILVAGEDETYLRFVPVTRSFQGREYGLRSQAITVFGVWPSLPEGIPQPSSPEGTPELVPVGSDDSGVQVFIRPGTDPSSGIAVAPGTPTNDPAGGNPEWTWWEPVPQ